MGTFAAAAMGLIAIAQTVPTAQDLFCHDLRRVLEAAQEQGGFDYLERSRAAPPDLGFPDGCSRTGDERQAYWLCSQRFAPDRLSRNGLARQLVACRPDAKLLPGNGTGDLHFDLPHAEIRILEGGGPRGHVGRTVEFLVIAQPGDR